MTFSTASATLAVQEELWEQEFPRSKKMSRLRFNMKRRIRPLGDPQELKSLAEVIGYGGNPEHKKEPGDFGLTPPVDPRPDKTLCDEVNVFERAEALRLLRLGVLRGMVSVQWRGKYPQNIWSVTDRDEPLEAELENRETGQYHGYPMAQTDPFRDVVLEEWKERASWPANSSSK